MFCFSNAAVRKRSFMSISVSDMVTPTPLIERATADRGGTTDVEETAASAGTGKGLSVE